MAIAEVGKRPGLSIVTVDLDIEGIDGPDHETRE
jgi:hypothetical protein